MAAAGGLDFLLFITGGGSADLDPLRDVETSIGPRLMGMVAPIQWVARPTGSGTKSTPTDGTPPAEGLPRHLPMPEGQCVEMVLEIARKEGRRVTVIDVDRAGERQPLVNRWVGENDVLPLLIRPDGARLEGLEEFLPARVRRFILGRA
jgi:hypothetical protein